MDFMSYRERLICSTDFFYYFFFLSSNSDDVVLEMKKILTIIIEESEPLNLELVDPLVTSVRKENQVIIMFSFITNYVSKQYKNTHPLFLFQITSPVCWKLGNEVLKKYAAKLKPHLQDKVQDMAIALHDYCIRK